MAILFSRRPFTHSLAILLGVAMLAIPLGCESSDAVSKKPAGEGADTQAEQQGDTKADTEPGNETDEGSSESESTPPATNSTDGDSTVSEPGSSDSGPEKDPFEIPEKGAAEIFAFINRLQRIPQEPIRNESREETEARLVEHSKKIMEVVIQATQRIRSGEATDEEFAKALSFEHQALNFLGTVDDGSAAKQAKQLLEDAKGDDRPQVLQVVMTGLFELAGKGDAAALASVAGVLDRLSKDDRLEILGLRLDSLFRLDSLGDKAAKKKLEQLIAELEKDKRAEVAALARRNSIRLGSQDWSELDEESKKRLIEDFRQVLTEGEFDNEQLNFGMSVAEGIELSGDGAAALQSYKVLTETMAGSGNRQLAMLAQQIAMMSGSVEWLGKDFEIFGTLANGSPFDPKKYQGKLVLVDFWATWCGPCVQELPNVLAAYEKYHDAGFEVVGVSLDSEPEALKSFVEARKIPWENLFGKDASERGYEQPMALRYEIQAIPSTFLLDGKGKVIAVNLRGQKLDKVLRQRLKEEKSKVEEESPEEAKKAPAPKSNQTDKEADKPAAEKPAKDTPPKKESNETPPKGVKGEAESKEESKEE